MVRVRQGPRQPPSTGPDDAGAVAVEFALLFPLLFLLLFGTLLFGWRIWEHEAAQSTAREAARLASLGIARPDAFLHDVVCLGQRNGLHQGTLTGLKITFSDPALAATGQDAYGGYVQVTLTYRSALGGLPMVTDDDGSFTASAVNRVEQLPPAGGIVTDLTVAVTGDVC
jgi:TadE-like protein